MPTDDRIAMPGGIRTLDEDAVWSLAEHLDVPSVLDAAARQATGLSTAPVPRPARVDRADQASLTDAPGPTGERARAAAMTVVRDPSTGQYAELPTAVLCSLRTAGCAAAAARRLVTPGVLTVGVAGTAPEVWWHVAELCWSLRLVSHVAVTADVSTAPPRLADQLDLAGVGLTAACTPQAAVFGASLVVATGPVLITAEHLTAGALVIEATPGAFPLALQGHADAVVPADADGSGVIRDGASDSGFTLVLPPTHTLALDAALAAELLTADTRMGLARQG